MHLKAESSTREVAHLWTHKQPTQIQHMGAGMMSMRYRLHAVLFATCNIGNIRLPHQKTVPCVMKLTRCKC
uniref:Uncharacterized protein n=1 Tax=Parascaris univalens TaxID=6257 RepID=A0A915C9M0_PARUN